MCFGAVEAPEPIEVDKPVFVRNPFLDDEDNNARTADALRRGRSSLVIPAGTGIGFGGNQSASAAGAGGSGGAAVNQGGSRRPSGISRPTAAADIIENQNLPGNPGDLRGN